MKHKGEVLIAIVCIVLAFFITLQIKSVTKNTALESTENLRASQLQVLLNNEKDKNQALYEELLELQESFNSIREEAVQSSDYLKLINDRLVRAEKLAGLTTLEGSGVIVTLADGIPTGSDEYLDDIVHEDDLLRVINVLNDAGAEAISLNGERILGTSEIRCAGSTVSINNNRYSAPFVIKAIGDPVQLDASLNMRYGIVEVLKSWNINVSVIKSNNVIVEAFTGTMAFKFAKTLEEEMP